jgi:hypothetical protein
MTRRKHNGSAIAGFEDMMNFALNSISLTAISFSTTPRQQPATTLPHCAHCQPSSIVPWYTMLNSDDADTDASSYERIALDSTTGDQYDDAGNINMGVSQSADASDIEAHASTEATAQTTTATTTVALERTLTLTDGIGVVVGIIVGSGIFASPGTVLQSSGTSPYVSLLVWLCAGIMVLLGGLCFAELGAAIPLSGMARCIDDVDMQSVSTTQASKRHQSTNQAMTY